MANSYIFEPSIIPPKCYGHHMLDGLGQEVTPISCMQFFDSKGKDTTCSYTTPFKISSLDTTITLSNTLKGMLGYSEEIAPALPKHTVKQLFSALLTQFPKTCIDESRGKSFGFRFNYSFIDRSRMGYPDIEAHILPFEKQVFETAKFFPDFYPFSSPLTIGATFYDNEECLLTKPDIFSKLIPLETCPFQMSQREIINNCLKAKPILGVIIGISGTNPQYTDAISARGPYYSLRDTVVEYLNRCENRSVISMDEPEKELSTWQWVKLTTLLTSPFTLPLLASKCYYKAYHG